MAAPARNKKRVRNPALTRLKLLQATIDLIAVRQMDAAPMQRRTASGAMIVLNHRNAARVLIAGALAGKDFTIRHPLYKLTRKMLKVMFGETHKRADNNELAERFAAEWSRILARGIFRVPT